MSWVWPLRLSSPGSRTHSEETVGFCSKSFQYLNNPGLPGRVRTSVTVLFSIGLAATSIQLLPLVNLAWEGTATVYICSVAVFELQLSALNVSVPSS